MNFELVIEQDKVTAVKIYAECDEDRQRIRIPAAVLYDKHAADLTDNGNYLLLPVIEPGEPGVDPNQVDLINPSEARTAAEVVAQHDGSSRSPE